MKILRPITPLAVAVAIALGSLAPTLHAQPVLVEQAEAERQREQEAEREREARETARQERDEARRARELAREERELAREERELAREERERQREFEQALREARRALDEGRLDEARELFRALSEMDDFSTGAPLYWLAYVDARSGRISDALESLGDFFERFPRDVFFDDALALRIELARKSGDLRVEPPLPPQPPQGPLPPSELLRSLGLGDAFDQAMQALADMDIGVEIEQAITQAFEELEEEWEEVWEEETISVEEELRLLALDGLMETNPDRAVVYLRAFITTAGNSVPARRQALSLLSRLDHPEASDILLEVVRSADDDELRREALRQIGLTEGPQAGARALLAMYDDLDDENLRRAAIEGLMLSSDVDGLLQVFKREPSPELRAHVARHLGMIGALDELRELYRDEDSSRVLSAILDGFALAGDTQSLIDIALDSDDPAVVVRAVRALAVVGPDDDAGQALTELFMRFRGEPDVQEVVADSLASMGDGDALVRLYRQADDARERTLLVERLRSVGGDAAEQVYLEILEAGS